jgi:hypothetical protein
MTHTKTLACATALMMVLGSAAYAQTTSPSTTPGTGSSGLSPTAEECKTAAKMSLPECQKYRNQAQMPGSSTGTTGSSTGSGTSSGSMGTTGSSGTTK